MHHTQLSEKSQVSQSVSGPNLSSKKILRNAFFISLGKGLGALASFGSITALAYFIPRETAGSYQYIMATLTIVSIATLPGMNQALVRAVAKGREQTIFVMMRKRLLWGLLGSGISLLLGIWNIISGNTLIGYAFMIASLFVPLTDTFSNFAVFFWQGKKQFDRSALIHTAYYVGIAVLIIGIYMTTDHLPWLISGALSAQALVGYGVYRASTRKIVVTEIDTGSVSLGFHLTIMQAFKIIAGNIDRVIVFSLVGPAMVAVYSFAWTPLVKLSQLIPIGSVTLPELSTAVFTNQTKKILLRKTGFLFLIIIPVVAGLIIAAPLLFKIFFPHYQESVLLFQLLSLTLLALPVALLKSALIAFHKTKRLYVNDISVPIIKVGLMILLGMHYGMIGIITGILIGSVIEFILVIVTFITTKTSSDHEDEVSIVSSL